MKILTKTCIYCEEEVTKADAIKEYGTYFCSEQCLAKYKQELEKLNKETTLDDCC